MTNQEIVEKYLNSFGKAETMQNALNLLADDFKFTGPIMKHNSKEEFITAMKEMEPMMAGLALHGTAQNGEWVGAYYEFKSTIPGLESTISSEWFKVVEGKIKESYLVFDATEWRKVFEKTNA